MTPTNEPTPVAVQPVEEGERERALVYAVRHIRMVEKRWRLDHPDSKVHKRCADQLDMALRQIEVDNSLSRALASPTSSVAVQTEREQIASILALRARQIRQVLAAGDVPDADDLDGIAATLDMGAAALHTDPREQEPRDG